MNPILKKYKSFLFKDDIKLICKPLEMLGINYFHYDKKYRDQSRVTLSTNPEWIEHYYDRGFYKSGSLEGNSADYLSTHFLWTISSDQGILIEARDHFDIDNGFTIIKNNKETTEFFHFAGSCGQTSLINLYVHNVDLLYRFTHYFKEQAKELIELASLNRIYLDQYNYTVDLKMLEIFSEFLPQTVNDYVKVVNPKRYWKECGTKRIAITRAEIRCIQGIMQGKTAAEIASNQHISCRTVEKHLSNIKIKLSCNSKSQILKTLFNKNIDFVAQLWRVLE